MCRLYYACRQINQGVVKWSVILFNHYFWRDTFLKSHAVTFLTNIHRDDAVLKTFSKRSSYIQYFSEGNQFKVRQVILAGSVGFHPAKTKTIQTNT